MAKNRVTQEDIDALLDSANTEEATLHGKVLVVDYQLPTRGGFTITGRGAVVEPANFSLEIGRRVAREDAANQLWQLEGYLKQLELAELITFN
jgi:Phage protein (N4 Gp49/phage Sf6 gene 66) family